MSGLLPRLGRSGVPAEEALETSYRVPHGTNALFYNEGVLSLAKGEMDLFYDRVTCHLMHPAYRPDRGHTAEVILDNECVMPDYRRQVVTGLEERVVPVTEFDPDLRDFVETGATSLQIVADDVSFGENVTLEARGLSLVIWPQGGSGSTALLYYPFEKLFSSFGGEFEVAWSREGLFGIEMT
jgi:hypothetical protein